MVHQKVNFYNFERFRATPASLVKIVKSKNVQNTTRLTASPFYPDNNSQLCLS